MERRKIFTFRANYEERQLISKLATLLHRSQSDAIRFILFYTMRKIEQDPHWLELINSS